MIQAKTTNRSSRRSPSDRLGYSLERQIIALTPAHMDAIWIDQATGNYWRESVGVVAAVRQYCVESKHKRNRVDDFVIPVLADFDLYFDEDGDSYLGMVCLGADPRQHFPELGSGAVEINSGSNGSQANGR